MNSSAERPAVSIVLLNYNHARFLGDALTALTAQLQADDELLAFDDASTDESVSIYERFAARYPQIVLKPKEKNQGVIACMNEGLQHATKDYVYFAAADDMVGPRFLDLCLAMLAAHPQAGLAACRCRIMSAEGADLGILPTPKVLDAPGYVTPEAARRAFLEDDNWLAGISVIYRRAPLTAAGGFRTELGSLCDGFASRLLAMGHGACYRPEALTSWRRMEEGYSSAQSLDPARTNQIAAAALRLMTGEFADIFPPGYASRWHGRFQFGARYYRWCHRQRERWRGSAGAPARVLMTLERIAVGLALFCYYRPRDIFTVTLRRVGHLFSRES
jgi:glycosyltransferase involved in cell wall biosynthesis